MNIAGIFMNLMQRLNVPVLTVKSKEGPEQYRIRMIGEKGQWEGVARCFEEEKLFLFYIYFQVSVPPEKRDSVREVMMRINYRLKCGGFYLDEETGYVLARVSQFIVGDEEEQAALVESMVRICGTIADSYYSDIMKPVFCD
ncbi:MAG: YbjN domain-containing protein [Lachnospiraceae bacterium]|nr:YbjN domain-containing protein [Lachnospiraceae bacterium]